MEHFLTAEIARSSSFARLNPHFHGTTRQQHRQETNLENTLALVLGHNRTNTVPPIGFVHGSAVEPRLMKAASSALFNATLFNHAEFRHFHIVHIQRRTDHQQMAP